MAIKRYTLKEMRKLKSQTDREAIRNMKDEDIDLTDPDAPDVTELIAKGLAHRVESPFIIGADGEITIRKKRNLLKEKT